MMKRNLLLIALCFLAGFFGCKVAERTGAAPAEKAVAADKDAAPAVLQAQKIQLVDANGRVTLSLEKWGEHGASLQLLDTRGKPSVILGSDTDGAALGFFDKKQNHRLDIMHLPSGPRVILVGDNGEAFVATPEQLGFADESGADVWMAP